LRWLRGHLVVSHTQLLGCVRDLRDRAHFEPLSPRFGTVLGMSEKGDVLWPVVDLAECLQDDLSLSPSLSYFLLRCRVDEL